MKFQNRFEEPGTLAKPGPIGRGVRLVLGAACLWGVASWIVDGPAVIVPEFPHPINLVPLALALWLVPPVLDIGWALDWKRRSQLGALVVGTVLAAVCKLTAGTWWAPPLGWFVLIFTVYVLGHLGISFVLAAALGTPGCEMRAIPHLWMRVTGRTTKEHYCPGFLDGLDRWELRGAG